MPPSSSRPRSASVSSVVLDNEAVQALMDTRHPKHARIVAVITEVNQRNRRRPGRLQVVVPTAVRVEAGWDRTDPAAADANRIARPRAHVLDGPGADRAVGLRAATGVSVVDACLGHAFEAASRPVAVITSDVADMARLRAEVVDPESVRVVRL